MFNIAVIPNGTLYFAKFITHLNALKPNLEYITYSLSKDNKPKYTLER